VGVSQVVNLLRIANDQLPSVQDRYEQLQKQNNQFESILRTKSKELQDLNSLIAETSKNLDTIKLEYKREAALVQGLQQQTARLETFVYNYKNNDEVYVKALKSIENKVQDLISNKKAFLKLAIFSLIQSMRNNPDKYSS
jgi:chromosome segregation ATPase